MLSIVFGIAEVLGLSICKLGSWAFVFKNPYQLCVGVLCMAGVRGAVLPRGSRGLYALLGRSRTGGGGGLSADPLRNVVRQGTGRASSLFIGAAWLPWSPCSGPAPWTGTLGADLAGAGVQR